MSVKVDVDKSTKARTEVGYGAVSKTTLSSGRELMSPGQCLLQEGAVDRSHR